MYYNGRQKVRYAPVGRDIPLSVFSLCSILIVAQEGGFVKMFLEKALLISATFLRLPPRVRALAAAFSFLQPCVRRLRHANTRKACICPMSDAADDAPDTASHRYLLFQRGFAPLEIPFPAPQSQKMPRGHTLTSGHFLILIQSFWRFQRTFCKRSFGGAWGRAPSLPHFNSTTVTPPSPSPWRPMRKEAMRLSPRRNFQRALRRAPVPLPWMR